MARMVVIGVAAVLALGLSSMSSSVRADYTQVSCEIDVKSNYALIGMKNTADVGKARTHEYDIQFEPNGLTLRFPPTYYAPEWGDTEAMVEYPHKGASFGVLLLRTPGALGSRQVTTIGVVQRACGEAIKKYIHENVEDKGIVVHLSETTDKTN